MIKGIFKIEYTAFKLQKYNINYGIFQHDSMCPILFDLSTVLINKYLKVMEQSGVYRQTIDPFYKQGTVFERDEAYYTQMLTGTRRVANNLQGTLRNSSLQKSQSRLSPNPNRQLQNQSGVSYNQINASQVLNQNSQAYNEQLEKNRALKRDLDLKVNGNGDFGNSSNVVVLQHYIRSQQEGAVLRQQQQKIKHFEEVINANDAKISTFKRAVQELQLRVNNIQAVDREIYKALQGSVNRDRQLLDKASAALARGERREELAKILQQIISP